MRFLKHHTFGAFFGESLQIRMMTVIEPIFQRGWSLLTVRLGYDTASGFAAPRIGCTVRQLMESLICRRCLHKNRR